MSKDGNGKPILLEVKCPYKRPIKFGYIPVYYYPQVQLNMFICNLEDADFIEYKPPDIMNIVRVKIDYDWLNENLPILEKFWKEVEYYRENDSKTHPKYKPLRPPKRMLDLRDTSDDETECIPNLIIRDI